MSKRKPAQDPYVRRRNADIKKLVGRGELLVEKGYGGGYLYRPRELLISARDERRLEPHLRELGARPDDKTNRELVRRRLDLRRWLLPDGRPLPEAVERLRRTDPENPPVVGPNHMLGSEPRVDWGGGGAPQEAPPLAPSYGKAPAEKALIGMLDTGVATDTAALHAELFASLLPLSAHDMDVLDDDGDGFLDSGGGHGTFILGILHQLAPELRLDVERVLGTHGFGDDLSVALGMGDVTGRVVNLSFGGYTHDNMEPPGMRAALTAAGTDVVFVASAGNHELTDPCWPAAFPEVVAVAALDTRTEPIAPAPFTNRGEWVDVCAPGVDIHSTYVKHIWPAQGSEQPLPFSGYAKWSGTSFAAPQVAAAIALLVRDKNLSPRDAADLFVAGLSPLPAHPELGGVYLPPLDLVYRGS